MTAVGTQLTAPTHRLDELMTYLANEGADHQDDLSFDDPATVTVSIMASAAAAMPNLRWRMAVESREGLLNILVVLRRT
jgi:hypothetical protein